MENKKKTISTIIYTIALIVVPIPFLVFLAVRGLYRMIRNDFGNKK